MTGPRFAPRDYAEDAGGFGRAETLRWKLPSGGRERMFLRSAQLQHRYVLRIRERLAIRAVGVKEYAAAAETSYPRLLRVLRGEAILRLEDIALADLVLGDVAELPRAVPTLDADEVRRLIADVPDQTAQAVLDRINAARRASDARQTAELRRAAPTRRS
jgi:hypothetical protein